MGWHVSISADGHGNQCLGFCPNPEYNIINPNPATMPPFSTFEI